ncbi:MAG: hypothetical protein PWP54_1459, partial [Thermosipho sp. (in: thermotogales)]|nr:hypothetical protein [Thermosipho sp. (in: thermotogales)]
NTYEIDKLEFETTYYWKVVVKDKNNKGVEGPVWQFTTNYLPKIDGEIEPEDGASGVLINPTLKWSATDRDGDKLTYDLYLGKGEELELVAKDLEENSYMVEGLENGETYSWKIVVKDERGGEVEGPVWKFTTNYLPEVPNEPYPIDESTNVSLLPTLSWKSFDKDGDEIRYDIYFGNENPPKLYKEDYNYDRIEVEKLEVNTTYYWKIVAKDERDGKVEGPVWSFSTTRPPEIPKEPIPEDNATGIRTKITLSWKASDPDNDILLYDLYFGTKDNLELKIENYESNKFTVPEKLKEGTTYYWKVVAKDDKGGITDGPIWNFTTNYPPNKPYNPSPKDGETGVSINPTLKWEASDPDGDKLIYDIYFGTEDNFKLVKSDYNSTTFNPGQLKENTTYYWKVVAKDEKNGRTESPFWSFTTLEKNSLPNKPTNPYPSNKEVDVSNHPILKWEATDPDGDILMYDVYFGTNENPPLVLKDSKNNYFDPGELSFNTTYYWKIVVRDEKGESIEGPLWQFKTKNSPNWQYTYGGSSNDLGYSILKTVDGGYVVVGYTNSNDYDIKNNFGGFDFMLLKLDKNGKLEWERTYGGSGYDLAYSIDHTQDNGYIIAGYTNSNDGNILENKGEFDAWIIKLDNLGNIIWQKTFGSSGIDFAKSIKQTKDGGYIVAGWTTSNDGDIEFNNGFSDYWILKLDDKGKIVWQKVLGGSNQDIAESITEVKDGYIVVGHSNSNDGDVKENKGKDDVWIVKLDFNGNILWTKTIGGNDFDYATSVFATKDGGFIVSINTTSSDGDIPKNNGKNDILLIKFDNDGNVIWKKVFGGSNDDYVYTLKETNNGYVIVGNTNSNDGDFVNDKRKFDAFIGILDENGNLKFIKTFGGSLDDYALDLVIDDGFVIVGYSNSNDGDITENKGNNDVWIFKMQKID